MKTKISLITLIWALSTLSAHSLSFNISLAEIPAPSNGLQHSLQDVQQLLKKACSCPVTIGREETEVNIELNLEDSAESSIQKSLELTYPGHNYQWVSRQSGEQINLMLKSPSEQGLSFGLYALLQEKLGFHFYHPRESHIPELEHWPLDSHWNWHAMPRFDFKGFHLHTKHPIELTEPLLNPLFKDGLTQVKEYFDWLVRNGQNYFQFYLLRTVDMHIWPEHAQAITDYAKSRGIVIGVDVGSRMLQQYAYRLFRKKPFSWKSPKRQIIENIQPLIDAGFDVITVDFSTTEFTTGGAREQKALQLWLNRYLNERGLILSGRQHVAEGSNIRTHQYESKADSLLDLTRIELIHTVMFYDLLDESVPAYGNKDFGFLKEALIDENEKRQAWYYPAASYWITFDHSMAMLLFPYLEARLNDILFCDSLGIPGHVTFSSGWELAYWLIDWSIARWSWRHETDSNELTPDAADAFKWLFPFQHIREDLNQLLDLQLDVIKEKELIRWLAASGISDELPKPLRLPFQPYPEKPYPWWLKKAGEQELKILENGCISVLEDYVDRSEALLNQLEVNNDDNLLLEEVTLSLRITQNRVEHKVNTLKALIAANRNNEKQKELWLEAAEKVRKKTYPLFENLKSHYRYSEKIIGGQYASRTAYSFGYLYPAETLHFWKREENQIRSRRFHPFKDNIWNVGRIFGLINRSKRSAIVD